MAIIGNNEIRLVPDGVADSMGVSLYYGQQPAGSELHTLAANVRAARDELRSLKSDRDGFAASEKSVRLRSEGSQNGYATFTVPSDLALIWIDREIDVAKSGLRKALIALRDYAVKELEGI